MRNDRLVTKTLLILTVFIFPFLAYAQNAEEIFQKGNSLTWDGKYKEALALVDSSLHMDSSLYQRYYFKADLEVKLGMIDEAINDVSKCIQKCKCPTRKYHVSRYYLERAGWQLLRKRNLEAMQDVTASIASDPRNWKAYNFRSDLFIEKGQLQMALNDLNKSYAINDNEASTLISRGKLRVELKDFPGACSDWSKVVEWGFDEYKPWIAENCKK